MKARLKNENQILKINAKVLIEKKLVQFKIIQTRILNYV
jgi:hypothetical protein